MIEARNLSLKKDKNFFLQDISFSTKANESLAILGKNGSGKSLLARSFIRLFDKEFNLNATKFKVDEIDIINTKHLRLLRTQIALIFQDAKACFHPLLNIGELFDISLKTNSKLNKKARKELALSCFESLNLSDLNRIWHSYSHQLSSGMAMRVQIALALALDAKVFICDEITANLDSKNALIVLDSLAKLKQDGKTLIIISHDLEPVRELADKILVLENGKNVEFKSKNDFFSHPSSSFAKELIRINEELLCF